VVREPRTRVALSIAGFDPSGGAGVLADIKTFAAHGIYGEACLTTLTVQNTVGVSAAKPVEASWLERSLAWLAKDNSFDVIKIGALGSEENVLTVEAFLRKMPPVPVVLDPVFRSTSGKYLLDAEGIHALKQKLLPLATWVTPNLAELAELAGTAVDSPESMENAVKLLQVTNPQIFFLVTCGDQKQPDDYLAGPNLAGTWVPGHRVQTRATHGTGCTLSSALAARIALEPEENPAERVAACKRYVEGAMQNAPGIGQGAGPLGHFWREFC
jgi:hydroxymethylpyrimidine/phosphomethylpyrimidine kinase